jgi:hypothetical protein
VSQGGQDLFLGMPSSDPPSGSRRPCRVPFPQVLAGLLFWLWVSILARMRTRKVL